MTTVACGYTNCSYNIDNLCGNSFIGINTKRYGVIQTPCSGFTTDKVDYVCEEVCTKELEKVE